MEGNSSRGTTVRRPVHETDVDGVPNPLTERLLCWLPGPRFLWLAVWLLVPWMNAAVTLMLQSAGHLPQWENAAVQLLARAAFSIAILLSVLGTAKITCGLGSLRSKLSEMIGEGGDSLESFRGVDSIAAPLLLTVGTAILFAGQSVLVHDDWLRGIVTAGAWLLIGIALWTFVWVYFNLQIGLYRLGQRPLTLRPYLGDRSLGLRPLGTLAFNGFWTFVVAFAPLVLTSIWNQLGLSIGLLVLLGGVAVFFLCMRPLHRQLVAAKEREVAWVRALYVKALEPVREEGTLEALLRQASQLSAAEALEKRAEHIQEWPFDERTFAGVVAISMTATAGMLGRVLLAPFGI